MRRAFKEKYEAAAEAMGDLIAEARSLDESGRIDDLLNSLEVDNDEKTMALDDEGA